MAIGHILLLFGWNASKQNLKRRRHAQDRKIGTTQHCRRRTVTQIDI